MYILGVDGGGTKTKAILFHTKLGYVWTMEAAASNPHSTSYAHSVMTIVHLIEKAYVDNELSENTDIYVSLGIAGLGRKAEQTKWLSIFRISAPHLSAIQEITIENDGKIALYSGTLGGDGIVSICGTGALTFGVNGQKSSRVGGWGHLVGNDPGSGYHIGSQALEAVFNQVDRIGKKTLITNVVLEQEKVETAQELVSIIYKDNQEKQRIAAFAPYVFIAAKQQDEVAQQIIQTTAKQIAEHGLHLYQTLFSSTSFESKIPFVLAGGVFQNNQMVREVTTALQDTHQLTVRLVDKEPVIGSVAIVLQRNGYKMEEIKRLLN